MSKIVRSRVHNAYLDMARVYTWSEPFTATGRVAVREPNLQAVARDFEVALEPPLTLSARRAFVPFSGIVIALLVIELFSFR